MIVTSNSFKNDELIPGKYTCDGSDFSPHLEWSGHPASTKCFCLICSDPDAPSGNWVHWVVANIPSTITHFEEHFIVSESQVKEIVAGVNDFRVSEYRGPCPPGGVHHYFFHVFALDMYLPVKSGMNAPELKRKMQGHILGEGVIMGKYSRK